MIKILSSASNFFYGAKITEKSYFSHFSVDLDIEDISIREYTRILNELGKIIL